MIALSLTGILLTLLFCFFVESVKIEKKLDAARAEITARQHLQTRLETVLSSIARESSAAPFYTRALKNEKSLVALFDNGIDPDPAFSGSVMGRIYLDAEKNLVLTTWPLDVREPNQKNRENRAWRKEVLLSHVENFEFEFMAPKKEDAKKEKSKPINASWEWRTQWPKSRAELPPVVRLSVWEEKQKEPLRFAILLPSVEPIIAYGGRP